jgi:hypothetical protein
MALFIRTTGIECAEAKIMLVNLAYNMKRLILPRATGGHRISACGAGDRSRK